MVLAQPMMGTPSAGSSGGQTAREEAAGKAIWEKLQAKQRECQTLTDEDYDSLGEYFMGRMVGASHEAMNRMMTQMMGEAGEKQMHIALGKRNGGCDPSFIPVMGSGFGNMMSAWGGFSLLGWFSMILFWLLLVLGVIALLRYLGDSRKRSAEDRSPLDILKERYARGEIDKKEFAERKKDLDLE